MAKLPETTRETAAKGPSMSRSQAQIAMSYAPGQHFTFGGGGRVPSDAVTQCHTGPAGPNHEGAN